MSNNTPNTPVTPPAPPTGAGTANEKKFHWLWWLVPLGLLLCVGAIIFWVLSGNIKPKEPVVVTPEIILNTSSDCRVGPLKVNPDGNVLIIKAESIDCAEGVEAVLYGYRLMGEENFQYFPFLNGAQKDDGVSLSTGGMTGIYEFVVSAKEIGASEWTRPVFAQYTITAVLPSETATIPPTPSAETTAPPNTNTPEPVVVFGWNPEGTVYTLEDFPTTMDEHKAKNYGGDCDTKNDGSPTGYTYQRDHGCWNWEEALPYIHPDGVGGWYFEQTNKTDLHWMKFKNPWPVMVDGWVSDWYEANPVDDMFKISGNWRGVKEDVCGRTSVEVKTWNKPEDHLRTGIPGESYLPVQGYSISKVVDNYGKDFAHLLSERGTSMQDENYCVDVAHRLVLMDEYVPTP